MIAYQVRIYSFKDNIQDSLVLKIIKMKGKRVTSLNNGTVDHVMKIKYHSSAQYNFFGRNRSIGVLTEYITFTVVLLELLPC